METFLFLLSASLFVFALRLRRLHLARTLRRQHGCQEPPCLPHIAPLMGLDLALKMLQSYNRGQRSVEFWHQHKQHGTTFRASILGTERIFTSDAENIRAMSSTSFQSWGIQAIRLKFWEPLIGAGVMNMDPPHWQTSRKLIQPMFKRANVSILPSFKAQVNALLTQIPGGGSTVDLQPLFARLILNFTMEFIFGMPTDSLKLSQNSSAIEFLNAIQKGKEEVGKRTQMSFVNWLYSKEAFRRACTPVHDMADRYIDQASDRSDKNRMEDSGNYALVDELLKETDDRDYIRAQLLNVFLAAHDTTAILMTNVIFNLARHPHVYAELRREVCSSGDLQSSLDGLRKVRYLWNTVMETSRLTPVVGQNARIALEDTILPRGGGVDCQAPVYVPKGTAVQLDFLALHRCPRVFGADPDAFRPSRWNEIKVGAWDYLPFSGGPRVCPGQNIALMQVSYVVGRIAQQFDRIENRDSVHGFIESYRIVSFSKNGCKVALQRSDSRQ